MTYLPALDVRMLSECAATGKRGRRTERGKRPDPTQAEAARNLS
jgi:hypothetical protein